MTKTTTTLVYTRCNICESPKIYWKDDKNENHLCEVCMKSENDSVFEHGDYN